MADGPEARDIVTAAAASPLASSVARVGPASSEPPLIHAYESFLAAFDPSRRARRGAFYTPAAVVSFVVAGVDRLLREEFDLPDGLADVSERAPIILDPAAGTGAFLVGAIGRVHATVTGRARAEGLTAEQGAARWRAHVGLHLLPRLRGIELMPGAARIARLAVAGRLRETGYRLDGADGIDVRCDDALDAFLREGLGGLIDQEAVLSRRPLVILGNPPWSALSANLSARGRSIIDAYRCIGGAPIRERGMLQLEKNLQDDYIKFFALSQRLVEAAGSGVVGLVTNHSYLDGPTLRGVRWGLASAFGRIEVVDLHGNANKRGRSGSDAVVDQNLFSIRQGGAVTFLSRRPNQGKAPAMADVVRSDLFGTRAQKALRLAAAADGVEALPRAAAVLRPPDYAFVADRHDREAEWHGFVPLTTAFRHYSTGTETGCDALLLDFDRAALLEKVRRFAAGDDLGLQANGHASSLRSHRAALAEEGIANDARPILFRPFDRRWALLKKSLLKTNSFAASAAVSRNAPALVTTRQTKEDFGLLVVDGFSGHKCVSAYDRSYVFPSLVEVAGGTVRGGVAPAFVRQLIGHSGDDDRAALRDAFHYLVAILSAPSYQTRFAHYLATQFPRIPMPAPVTWAGARHRPLCGRPYRDAGWSSARCIGRSGATCRRRRRRRSRVKRRTLRPWGHRRHVGKSQPSARVEPSPRASRSTTGRMSG